MFNGEMVLWPEAGILEVLDSNQNVRKPGKGELLATGLINNAMGLISFKIGDLGEISDDTVSGFQVLDKIEERLMMFLFQKMELLLVEWILFLKSILILYKLI